MSPKLEAALNILPMTAVTIVFDALKQARNEALEEAARHCDSHGYVVTASEIRAMKK